MSADLVPSRHQPSLFTVDIVAAAIKELAPHLEHPFFALSTRPSTRPFRYEDGNGNWLELLPGYYGLPTIHDQDILIYCTSSIMADMNRGRPVSPRVHMRVSDFIEFANRPKGGIQYRIVEDALRRITTTSLRTNIMGEETVTERIFGVVDEASFIRRRDLEENPTALLGCDVVLSDRMMDAIQNKKILTLARDYFRIRRPLDRRIYQIARKHCGRQERFEISVPKLYSKSGSLAPLWRFRQMYRDLVARSVDPERYPEGFPEYMLLFDPRRDVAEFACRKERVRTTSLDGVASPEVREKVRRLYPGWIQGIDDPIGSAWRAWKSSRDEPVHDPDAAYLGFAHKWVQAKILEGKEPEAFRQRRQPCGDANRWWWGDLNPAWRAQFTNMVEERYGKRVVIELGGGACDESNLIRLAYALNRDLAAG